MYTVANDTLLELTYSSMPVVKNGIVYVPYTFFTNNFDIRTIYDSSSRALMYGSFGKTLIFDMKNEVTYDSSMNAITQTGIYVKNQPFVPAEFVAEYFGLNYSLIGDGPIVRIYNNNVTYPDSFLTTTFKTRMSEMKMSLINESSEEDPPETVVPPSRPDNDPPPVEVIPIVDVYTAFKVSTGGMTDKVLDILKTENIRSAFFIDASDIIECRNILRRIWFEGHTIGIFADAEDKDIVSAIEDANNDIKTILKLKTNLLMLENSETTEYESVVRDNIKNAGYRYWQSNISYEANKKGLIKDSVLDNLSDGENTKVLLLDDSESTINELESILDGIKSGSFRILSIDSYSLPINSYGDAW